jgi:hypothetical protein
VPYEGLVGSTSWPLSPDASDDQSGGPTGVVVGGAVVVPVVWDVVEQPDRDPRRAAVPTPAAVVVPHRRNCRRSTGLVTEGR